MGWEEMVGGVSRWSKVSNGLEVESLLLMKSW